MARPSKSSNLIKLIDAERYEEALGVTVGHGKSVDAFDLKAEHAGNSEACKRINVAESKLRSETPHDLLMRLRNVGVGLLNKKQPDSAIVYLKYAADTGRTATDYLQVGIAYLRAGNYAASLKSLERALAREGELPGHYQSGFLNFHIMKALLKRNRFVEAERHAREAARKGRSNREIGQMFREHEQCARSIPFLEAAGKDDAEPLAWVELGQIYIELKQHVKAVSVLKKALQQESAFPPELVGVVDFFLFIAYRSQTKHQPAERHLEAAARKGHKEAKQFAITRKRDKLVRKITNEMIESGEVVRLMQDGLSPQQIEGMIEGRIAMSWSVPDKPAPPPVFPLARRIYDQVCFALVTLSRMFS